MDTILNLPSEFKTEQLADFMLDQKDATIRFMNRPNQKMNYSPELLRNHNLLIISLLGKYEFSKVAYNHALGIADSSKAKLLELKTHKENDAELLVNCLHDDCSFLFTGELEH